MKKFLFFALILVTISTCASQPPPKEGPDFPDILEQLIEQMMLPYCDLDESQCLEIYEQYQEQIQHMKESEIAIEDIKRGYRNMRMHPDCDYCDRAERLIREHNEQVHGKK